MAIITSTFTRKSDFTTNTSDSYITIGNSYLDFSGYDSVTTMYFYTDGGLTTATNRDPADSFNCSVQLKINGSWTANISSTWLDIPAWGPDILVEGYFDVSSKSADIIRYGIDGIRLKFGTYAEVKAWGEYDYICEFTATKSISLGKPTNVSATQNSTTLTVNWEHASYGGSGTRKYTVIANNYDLWGGYHTLGTGYTGTSASIAIEDSWRGYPLNIWVIATATDYDGDGNWSDTYATITLQILGIIRYCYNGQWKECIPYYGVNGDWKECIPYYGANGQWKELI